MKLAVCVLLAAAGASALTPPKSAVAATRGGSLEAGALKAAAAPIKEVSAVPRGGVIANFVGVGYLGCQSFEGRCGGHDEMPRIPARTSTPRAVTSGGAEVKHSRTWSA